jgi:hypothetical protein
MEPNSHRQNNPRSKLMVWEAANPPPNKQWLHEPKMPDFEHISARISQVIGVTEILFYF